MAWMWTILSIATFLYLLQKLLTNKKKLPPGPTGLPIIGHFHLLGKNPHRDLCHQAREYGPIMYMRFGSVPTIVVSSPAGAELILKTYDHIFANRPTVQAAKYIFYDQKNVAMAPYGKYWRDMRKLCTLELLSSRRINQFQATRNFELGLLVSLVKEAANGRQIVDLSAMISDLNRDMTCLMVFGRKFTDSDMDEKGFESMAMETSEVMGKFNLRDYFPYLGVLDLQGLTHRMKEVSKIFDAFLGKIINDRVQMNKGVGITEDFVDVMMSVLESGDGSDGGYEFDLNNVKAMLLDMLLGGLETSTVTIDWTIVEVIRNPHVMKKLQQELELVVGMDRMVEESHLDKLNYLDCVVKETLRFHPPAPLLVPHESMEDCILEGYHIPNKSRVLVNIWAIGRDPSLWSNPETFSPDRFIEINIDLKGHDFQFIPFGSGRRGCPGMQLGLTVVKLVVAQLVHCFDWELPDGMRIEDLDMSEVFGVVTARAEHLMAIPNYRLHK